MNRGQLSGALYSNPSGDNWRVADGLPMVQVGLPGFLLAALGLDPADSGLEIWE